MGLAGAPEVWGIPVDGAAVTLGGVSIATGAFATYGDCATGEVTCGMDAIRTVSGLAGSRLAAGARVVAHDAAEGIDIVGQVVSVTFAWAGQIVTAAGGGS